jgi:hypothetical protein
MNAQTQEIVNADEPVKASASIISVIERAAMNPDVDIDKMERLLEMQERIMARDAEAAFNVALSEMQPELPTIIARDTGQSSKYAKWEKIYPKIMPVINKHGFALSFKTDTEPGQITVTAILRHKAGHSDQTSLPLPSDTSGNKNNVQAVGSSVQYGKRYAVTALLNLNVAGEDDDAHKAGAGELITQEQYDAILKRLNATNSDISAFCKFLKIPKLEEMPASKHKEAKAILTKKENQNG